MLESTPTSPTGVMNHSAPGNSSSKKSTSTVILAIIVIIALVSSALIFSVLYINGNNKASGNGSKTTDSSTDKMGPVVTINSPTAAEYYFTTTNSISLVGTASDSSGVKTITWANSGTDAHGACTGTTSWSVSGIYLASGNNIITITAIDGADNSKTDSITVNYSFNEDGNDNKNADVTAPVVTITSPSSASKYTSNSGSVTLNGVASDSSGIYSVSWTNSLTGDTGTCSGTLSWSTTISLTDGDNIITIAAQDSSGNKGTDTLTVTYSSGNGNNYGGSVTLEPSSARPLASTSLFTPDAGNWFIRVDLTITNGAGSEISLSPYDFELVGSDGLTYSYSWKTDNSMADGVSPGLTAPITIGFEVPNGVTAVTLKYSPLQDEYASSCSLSGVWVNDVVYPTHVVTLGTPSYQVVSSSNSYVYPDDGNKFVQVSVKVTNVGTVTLSLNPYYFKLSTLDGLEHDYTWRLDYDIPDGLQVGASYTINICYEISETSTPTSLKFDNYSDVVVVNF